MWELGVYVPSQLEACPKLAVSGRGSTLEQPFSMVLFLIVLRLLRYLEIFPMVAVPWTTFVKALPELVAYSAVFVIISLGFSLL
jgi:hypothetical protein